MSNNFNELMREYNEILNAETNEKIRKALGLYLRLDRQYKQLILMVTGFSGKVTGRTLREHFDSLDLTDELDQCIDNMERDIALSSQRGVSE